MLELLTEAKEQLLTFFTAHNSCMPQKDLKTVATLILFVYKLEYWALGSYDFKRKKLLYYKNCPFEFKGKESSYMHKFINKAGIFMKYVLILEIH